MRGKRLPLVDGENGAGNIRNIRGEAKIKPNQPVTVLFQGGTDVDQQRATQSAAMLQRLANVETTTWLDDDAEPPPNALALVGDLKVMVPLAGLIDVAEERSRLGKELQRVSDELDRTTKKLANQNFVKKAPPEVVAKERDKAAELETAIATFKEQLAKLDEL